MYFRNFRILNIIVRYLNIVFTCMYTANKSRGGLPEAQFVDRGVRQSLSYDYDVTFNSQKK